MNVITVITTTMLGWGSDAFAWLRRRDDGPERGDVPGWVLITLMTAGLVTALWAIAGPQLSALFSNAINSVTGP